MTAIKPLNFDELVSVPKEPELQQRIEGIKIYGAPQPTLSTVATDTVDTTYGLAEANALNNVRLRLNEVEGVLIKLGFIKGTSS